jgi:5-hydroxyisourate hydrolase
MGKLSTHVLDTAGGRPAAGMKFELYHVVGRPTLVVEGALNADGRTDEPLIAADLKTGHYVLTFHVGDYFHAAGSPDAKKFLDRVSIDFHVSNPTANYHVPLLVSPWSYSTYRGS